MPAISEQELGRKAEVSIRLSEFEMPPMQDVLLVGRKAPIGPEAVRRMVDAVSPEQYDIIRVDEGPIEAVVIRKSLLHMVSVERLLPIILEEGLKVANDSNVIKAQLEIVVLVKRAIEL